MPFGVDDVDVPRPVAEHAYSHTESVSPWMSGTSERPCVRSRLDPEHVDEVACRSTFVVSASTVPPAHAGHEMSNGV